MRRSILFIFTLFTTVAFAQPTSDEVLQQRAKEIKRLQQGDTTHKKELIISDLFQQTKGSDLTRLKNMLDEGGTHQDLEKLLFHDIDDHSIRNKILKHIKGEGEKLPVQGIKVFSDIDDTIYANYKDQSFPKKTLYPGVLSFYSAFDSLVFITARPEDRVGWIETLTHKKLQQFGFPPSVVLTGDLPHIITSELIAKEKYRNFLRYKDLYPEYNFIFIGDNGQGDVILGKKMREKFPERVKAVLIHQIDPLDENFRAEYQKLGIHFFKTYVDAAKLAASLNLINDSLVPQVIEQSLKQMESIQFDSQEQRDLRLKEIQEAITSSV